MRFYIYSGWKAFRAGKENESWPVAVPGTLFADLAKRGVIEDWFYGTNEGRAMPWLDADYVYRCTFKLPEEFGRKGLNLFLECEGLDTLATIFINGKEVAKTANMHRRYRFPLQNLLRADSENLIEFRFGSAIRYISEKNKACGLKGVVECIEGYPHIRKAHSNFGWDWGPKLPDLGIWRPISIAAYEGGIIDDVIVGQSHFGGKVKLDISVKMLKLDGAKCEAVLALVHPDGKNETATTAFSADNSASGFFVIDNPRLWWPNGLGGHPLYRLKCEIRGGNGAVDDSREMNIGLRTLELRQQPDKWGKTFMFVVNGVPVFAKGANWIPEDALHGRRKELTRPLVQASADANFNMLRVWGGGYYPDNEFYDYCDELGILVWQDFMFACAVYRLTPEFREEITEEARDNVRRLRHHPCLALWCGNNENELAVSAWWKKDLPEDAQGEYLEHYEKLLPEACREMKSQVPYWPASPSSGGNFENPNSEAVGDCHYWNVWHGADDFRAYANSSHRFVSEFGFQSFPCMKTVRSYCPPEEFSIESKTFLCHQRSKSGNAKIMGVVQNFFRPAKDFESLLYLSLAYQAEAIRHGVEHWRRNRHEFHCMGTIYWQLNDNWPISSWSSIDYFGRWKPLHYAAKRFYEPVLLSLAFDTEKGITATLVNDLPENLSGVLKCELLTFDGALLKTCNEKASCPGADSARIANFAVSELPKGLNNAVLYSEFLDDSGKKASAVLHFASPKDWELGKPEIKAGVLLKDGGAAEISLSSSCYAPYVFVDLRDCDAVFSDNFFSLLPKKTKTITCPWKKSAKELEGQLKIFSLFDTCSSPMTHNP